MKTRLRQPSENRRGTVLVLTAVLMSALLVLVAFAVDLGYLMVAGTELQRTADAAAMAAAWELVDLKNPPDGRRRNKQVAAARKKAQQFVTLNQTEKKRLRLFNEDVKVGLLRDPQLSGSEIEEGGSAPPNAVYVQVQRTASRNSEVPLFFARVLGIDRAAVAADATAVLNMQFKGFRNPPDGSNLNILPFAIDAIAWEALLAGNGFDEYKYDAEGQRTVSGRDGVKEIRLYPNDTGSSGNLGTLDIGASNNSTADIARQILHGITPADLAHIGGSLEFNSAGKLYLNADPGLSAGFKDALLAIKGQTRMIPVFSDVQGSGGKAQYTITKFVGVRIMDATLTGGDKHIVVQPAAVVTRGGIQGTGGETTDFIFSPVRLVR